MNIRVTLSAFCNVEIKARQDLSKLRKVAQLWVSELGFTLRSGWFWICLVFSVLAFHLEEKNDRHKLCLLCRNHCQNLLGRAASCVRRGFVTKTYLLSPLAVLLHFFFSIDFVCPCFVVLYLLWYVLFAIFEANGLRFVGGSPALPRLLVSSLSASLTCEVLISWASLLGLEEKAISIRYKWEAAAASQQPVHWPDMLGHCSKTRLAWRVQGYPEVIRLS